MQKSEISWVFQAYMEAIEFTECHSDNEDISPDATFSDELKDQAYKDCEEFIEAIEAGGIDIDDWSCDQLGHDFWLTRNGHGAGFWDRDLPEGDELTQVAEAFGVVDIYQGDDGLIYSMGG